MTISQLGPAKTDGATHRIATLGRVQVTSLVYVAPLLLFVVMSIALPSFPSRDGVMSLFVLAAILGIASLGQTWAIIIGGLDLSIPAVIGMANVLLTHYYAEGWSLLRVIAVVLMLATAVGATNAIVSSVCAVHPLIVTLGMGSVVTGAVLLSTGNNGGVVPHSVTDAVSPRGHIWVLPVPLAVGIWIAVVVMALGVEHRTVFGRRLFALGANELASKLTLIRPHVVRVVVYVVSAVCGAVAGLLLGGFSGGSSADIGQPYLFSTITAVVVGGTSLLGGSGSYLRTVAGALLTTEFTILLIGIGVNANVQQILLGLIILTLVAVYGRDRQISQRL
jgi:ribose transport system permease protein